MRPLALLLLGATLLAMPARAQFQGYSIPQTTQATPFNNVSCTGSAQTATVGNFGQTEHYITVTTSGVQAFRATIQGSHDGTTFNDISDVATLSGNTVMGQGYYPVAQVSVTCSAASGSFTVRYSGQATAPAPQIGAMASAQLDKTITVAAPAGVDFTSQTLRTPFGTSGGALYFQYSGAGPSGSFLSVVCGTLAIAPSETIATFPVGTTGGTQFFPVPGLPCDFLQVNYTHGGASAFNYSLSYVFNQTPITGGDPCQSSTIPKISVSISLTATGKLVSELTSHTVYVCGYSFTLVGTSGTQTAQFESGTGVNCAVVIQTLTGTYTSNGTTPLLISSAGGGYQTIKGTFGAGLCLALTGTGVSAQGYASVIQE